MKIPYLTPDQITNGIRVEDKDGNPILWREFGSKIGDEKLYPEIASHKK
jgi:hypothetical protein